MIRIYFDFEIDDDLKLEEMDIPKREFDALITLKEFIYQRVKVLEDKADLEPDGYIYYRLNPPRIEYRYSRELGEKMNSCITEADHRHIATKLQSGFGDMFN